jgi:hypothetical protein
MGMSKRTLIGKMRANKACTRQRVRAGKFASLRGMVIWQIGLLSSHPLRVTQTVRQAPKARNEVKYDERS